VFDIDIRVEGVEDIVRALESVPDFAERAIDDAAATLRNLVIGRTPVATGELKDSWSPVEKTSTGFTFGTDKDYAVVLEEGGYSAVGPRTIAVAGGIFSRQAPGGIMAPLLQDEELMDKIVRRIAEDLVRSLTRAT
jgi:hypothetical protein